MIFYKGDIPSLSHPTCVTAGIFDGIHVGHQYLIKELVRSANKKGCDSLILTFYPHPGSIALNETTQYIISEREQERIFEELGVKILVRADFYKLYRMSSGEYIEFLVDRLKMQEIFVGHDHSFGRNREGNAEVLKKLSKEKSFSCLFIPDVSFGGKKISSSRIKESLSQGEVETASYFLGRPYSVSGIVTRSVGRGEKLGFPTANVLWDKDLFCPKNGVYFVSLKIDRGIFYGMANIGKRPTFDGNDTFLEVHIFDFDGYLYNKEITVFFHFWIRNEMKFNSNDELILQLKKDKEKCKTLFTLLKQAG
ncbi:TPA: hypothetical protein DCX16_01400 [bacterium]|nr:hypothetical protein [bacterium]